MVRQTSRDFPRAWLRAAAWLVALSASAAASGRAAADEALVVLPPAFTLTGPESRQPLLVQRITSGHIGGQVTEGVTYSSSDPGVVRIENAVAIPAGNGTATITATAGEHTAQAEVTVAAFDQPHRWNFRIHVESVLTRFGCNSGACHGAAAGKNGFKLSLRGYDPEADYFAISRQARGRRIVPDDPGRSLLLTKPTGAVPHKGGLRFDTDSLEHRVLAEWIAAGQVPPADEDPRLERLEILPRHAVLQPNAAQQFLVRAHFTDGHAEDVTRWAKFSSADLTVADVNDQGRVAVMGHGEGAIVAWYLATNVVATVTVPYPNAVKPELFAEAKRNSFIDELVLEKLQSLNLPPSPPTTDEQFIRRAFLDTIGTLPTVEEVRRFLADQAADKRERLIDDLLIRPEFVDYWTYKWCDLLLVSGAQLRPQAVDAYYRWVRRQVADNTPWDRLVREIVTARGSTFENGAANFFSLHQDPLSMAETTSMAFLGMSIQCARCHDHPLEKWTNDQYYGMANLFARVRGKGWGGDFRAGDGLRVIFTTDSGEVIQPRTGRPQPPRPLDAEPLDPASSLDRRDYLADWLTAPENPYFSRAIVNRVWANFFGIGIVEPVDDLRVTNPPSNPELLDALAAYLQSQHFNLKALMRLILSSQTYQRSSETLPENAADRKYYARYKPRRLKAEVLLDAVSQVTGVPTTFPDYPPGTRALQLRDAGVASYFLQTFGRPERVITCECERSDEPSMKQVLHIVNGDTVNQKLAAENGRISQLLSGGLKDEAIVEEAYLSALSRKPTEAEQAGILKVLAETPPEEKRAVIEDLYWGLLSSREFLFQH